MILVATEVTAQLLMYWLVLLVAGPGCKSDFRDLAVGCFRLTVLILQETLLNVNR